MSMQSFLATGLVVTGLALLLPSNAAEAAAVDVTLQQIDRTANNGSLGTIDLTQAGAALDWLKPVGADLTFAEKNGATLLTTATQGATFTPGTYADDGYTFTWSGGDSNSVSGSTIQGSNNTGAGQNVGFRTTFTAPAPGDYTLKWYSAANNTPNWRLTGTIGAATDFQQAGANVGTTTGNGGVDEFHWTVTFTADSAGQVLTLDLLNTTTTSSAIALTGVTVVPEPAAAGLGAAVVGLLALRRRRAVTA